MRTESYDGLTTLRNNGYLLRAEITAPGITLWRGIHVSSTRSEVERAYPEAAFCENGAVYEIGSDPRGPSIDFFFNPDNVVERIIIRGWSTD